MKKLIVLLMVVCFLLIGGEAKALAPLVPVAVVTTGGAATTLVAVSCGLPLGILGAMGAGLLIGEFIQYAQYPECRKEPTMGDLSNCVQKSKLQKK